MVTLEEAKKIASNYADDYNDVEEFDNAFVFDNNRVETDGGFYPLVVTKEDGSTPPFIVAAMNGLLGSSIRRLTI